jgi:hypothetical protein
VLRKRLRTLGDAFMRYMRVSRFTGVVLVLLVVKGFVTFGPIVVLLLVGAVIALLLLMNARTLPVRLYYRWPIYAVVTGLVAAAVTPYLTDRTGGDAFYSAVTQIIPVLMLTIAVELRPRPKWPLSGELGLAAIVMLVLAIGEGYALNALDRGSATSNDRAGVILALVTGFAAVVFVALSQPPAAVDTPARSDEFESETDWRSPDGYR